MELKHSNFYLQLSEPQDATSETLFLLDTWCRLDQNVLWRGFSFFGSRVCAVQRGVVRIIFMWGDRVVSMEQRCMWELQRLLHPPESRLCGAAWRDDCTHMLAEIKTCLRKITEPGCHFNTVTCETVRVRLYLIADLWFWVCYLLTHLLASTYFHSLILLQWSHWFGSWNCPSWSQVYGFY